MSTVVTLKVVVFTILLAILTSCANTPGRQSMTLDERVAADVAWYCGPGMLGVRWAARTALRWVGVPVPDTCKVGAALKERASMEDEATTEEVIQSP